ncbi:glycosyltransferase [Falsiroseomonas sp. E2-1-a20]|uniref:glycosyltransferase n=1 Tax=Falsiroseomonas sp. E2-1-a20 TaxID=3239300 RepID=UPI003F403B07
MRISLVCPVYDTPPELLRAAAHSVLSATSAASAEGVAQLILVDDASPSAATRAALAALAEADRRVLLLRSPRNRGPASARNLGLSVAIGEWVGFLDADDLWLPGQLDRLHGVATAHPDAGWIGSAHAWLNPDGGLEAAPMLPAATGAELGPGLRRHAGPPLTGLMLGNFWMHLGAMLARRALLQRIGGFAEGLVYGEDQNLMARLSTVTPLHYLATPGYAWRRGRPSLTSSAARLRAASLRQYAAAARDPLLRDFRREIHWARYSATKGLAVNNLLAGRRMPALALALRAWMLDPREVGELGLFLRLWTGSGRIDPGRYSKAEGFVVRAPQQDTQPDDLRKAS